MIRAAILLACLFAFPANAKVTYDNDGRTFSTAQARPDRVRHARTASHHRQVRAVHSRVRGAADARAQIVGGRPAGCPARWCGCWLMQHYGFHDRRLWRAIMWASLMPRAPGPGVGRVVVWKNHVGVITGEYRGQWIVLSGNDSGQIRERTRSIVGAVAFVEPLRKTASADFR